MLRVFPLCLTSPLTVSSRSRSWTSRSPNGMGSDMGPNVSIPLLRSQELPSSRARDCMSLADTSLKTATWETYDIASDSSTFLQSFPNTNASSTSCCTLVTPSGMTMSSPSEMMQLDGFRNTVGTSGSSESSSATCER